MYIRSDGINRDPDMDQMGLSAGNRQNGKIVPFRVTFHSVTRYKSWTSITYVKIQDIPLSS